MFKEYTKDLGTVSPNTEIDIQFIYEGDINIKNVSASCGCTSAKWDKENNRVTALYRVQPIPHHLKMQGKTDYISTKKIKVLTDTQEITLTFTALVKE